VRPVAAAAATTASATTPVRQIDVARQVAVRIAVSALRQRCSGPHGPMAPRGDTATKQSLAQHDQAGHGPEAPHGPSAKLRTRRMARMLVIGAAEALSRRQLPLIEADRSEDESTHHLPSTEHRKPGSEYSFRPRPLRNCTLTPVLRLSCDISGAGGRPPIVTGARAAPPSGTPRRTRSRTP
jgi:hypothetical protein